MSDVSKETHTPTDLPTHKSSYERVKNIPAIQGPADSKQDAKSDAESQFDEKSIKQLLENDPDITSPNDGRIYHKAIQEDLLEKGDYAKAEVEATDIDGKASKRIREVQRGQKAGTLVEEGTIYDLYTETEKTISTAEIKPFSPTGVTAAEEKLNKQIDIEENYDGNHSGKTIKRELIFYDTRDGHVVLKGPANPTLEQAKQLVKSWGGSKWNLMKRN